MKIFRYIFLLLIGLFISQAISAQSVLTGLVRDKATNQPLIGANVFIVDANNRTLSGYVVDRSGEYFLTLPKVPQNLTVVFSFVGYETQTIKYTTQRSINILLKENDYAIEAISVTARQIERDQMGISKREAVAATQKMTLETIESAPVTSIVDALQGALANVDIISGGDPGSNSSIRIRGTSSLNASSEPLFVLDGIPFPVEVDNTFDFATANAEDYSQLLNISPNDLESIEVLKDAVATALWGSRASNGVLLITTKKGAKGRLAFSFNTSFQYKKETNTIPLLNAAQYRSLTQDAVWNSLKDMGANSINLIQLLYNTKEIGFFPDWEYFDEYNQNTNWVDEITKVSTKTINDFAVSGGGDKINYLLSIGYTNDQGTTIGTNFNRFNMRANITYKFSNRFKVTTSYSHSNGFREANWSGKSSPRSEAMSKMPNMSPYAIGPNGERTGEYFTPYEYYQGGYNSNGRYNPIASVYEATNTTKSKSNQVSFTLQYNILPGLDYKGIGGLDISTNRTRYFLPQSVTGVTWVDKAFNSSGDALSDQTYITTDNSLVFNKSFTENHKIIASAIFRTSDQVKGAYSSSVSGNSSSNINDPTSGGLINGMSSSIIRFRDMLFSTNINYTLYKNYVFNVSYRREGSSSIGKANRWKGFPVVGAAWQIGDEKFMDRFKWIDLAKLRFSWGQSGNAPKGAYSYIGVFKPSGGDYATMPAIQPSSIDLVNLDYEIVTLTNGGLDLELFNNKLQMSFELYDKTTTNLLMKDMKLPTSTGYEKVSYFNSGEMNNRGWEYYVNYFPVRNKTWTVNIGFNIAQNINKITELPINKLAEKYTFKNGEYAGKINVGDPLGSFYGYRYKGVYQNTEDTYMKDAGGSKVLDFDGKPIIMSNGDTRVFPGDAKYEDINGDGQINQYDIVYLGQATPTITGGFNFNITYKNLSLMGNFQGRAGQKAINKARMNLESMYGQDNQGTAVLRRWRSEGDQTSIPRALYQRGYNYLGSDRFVEDASFIRLKRLTLKYRAPKEWLRKAQINTLELFVTGYDIWTITNYTGQDPEVGTSGDVLMLAVDNASTPKPISFTVGLTFKF